MILSALFLLPQIAQAAPHEPQRDELRIIAVEQTGKPPFEPEGRVYRLTGKSVSRIKPGEILIIKRPKEPRDIGLLRVIAIQADTVTARLEVRGEAFPLKGDFALPLASLGIPGTVNDVREHRFPLRSNIPFPLTPPRLPRISNSSRDYGKDVIPLKNIPFPLNLLGLPSMPRHRDIQQPKTFLPPSKPKPLEEILANWPVTVNSLIEIQPPDKSDNNLTEIQSPSKSEILERNPFYFLPDNAELSARGLEKLQQWTQDWDKKDVRWFLAVPQSHLKLEKLLLERLTALQNELNRLGIANIEFRVIYEYIDEPWDVIYVCVESDF
jgi:hypothetical protein